MITSGVAEAKLQVYVKVNRPHVVSSATEVTAWITDSADTRTHKLLLTSHSQTRRTPNGAHIVVLQKFYQDHFKVHSG